MPINLNSFLILLILFFIYDHIQANHNENLNYHLSNTQHSNTHSNPFKFYKSFFNPNQYHYSFKQPAYPPIYPPVYSSVYRPAKRDLAKYEPAPLKYDLKFPDEYSKVKYPDDRIKYHPSSYEYKLNDLDLLTNHQHEVTYKEPNKNEIVELNTISDNEKVYAFNDLNGHDKAILKNKIRNGYEYPHPIDDDFSLRPMAVGDFSYDEQDKWIGTCTDQNALQSPIAINSRNTKLNHRTKVDLGVKYARDIDVELENKGHTVQFDIPARAGDMIITGPAFDYEIYKATAVHWHWGENDTIGSEHVLDGYRFPLEMHIVHYNTKYPNLDEALKHQDGTVVIGIFFQISRSLNIAMEPLIQQLEKVRCKGQKTDVKNVNLLRLFPPKVRRLYQYYGSLTTPPCTAAVNWIVLETPNLISSEQMMKFRLLTTDTLCQNQNLRNWRNLQDVKGRDIMRSVKL